MSSFGERIVRAMRLDEAVYEEVEADTTAFSQAMAVVALASVAGGVAHASATGRSVGFIAGTIASLIGWYVWAFLTYVIGTRLLPDAKTQADLGQLLRTLGFAAAPGLIQFVGVVPALARLSIGIASLWMLAATVVAVRQALDYDSTGRAIAVCVVGWLIQWVLVVLMIFLLLGMVWSLAVGGSPRPSF